MAENDSDDAREVRRDGRHAGTVEEWVFAAWTPDATLGLISGHRILGSRAWYWAGLARSNHPLLHITDFEVPVRADPFIVKGEAMWAEHFCDDPMRQWSIGNETYASALEDPDDALGRAYGDPTPIAFDLEWYATAVAQPISGDVDRDADGATGTDGFEQDGVVHGSIEVLGEPTIDLVEIPARRWHRWVPQRKGVSLGLVPIPEAPAHTQVRAPFRFVDGTVLDLVLTPQGWARRPTDRNRMR